MEKVTLRGDFRKGNQETKVYDFGAILMENPAIVLRNASQLFETNYQSKWRVYIAQDCDGGINLFNGKPKIDRTKGKWVRAAKTEEYLLMYGFDRRFLKDPMTCCDQTWEVSLHTLGQFIEELDSELQMFCRNNEKACRFSHAIAIRNYIYRRSVQ